ncbi:MAG: DUF4132 domain-containing protein [Planctomycetes bacterium]|nr:DUF4132 domain-containing protein [Planctomycetota bacterium]
MDLSELISRVPKAQASKFQGEFKVLRKSVPEIGDKTAAEMGESSIALYWAYAGDEDRIAQVKATLLLLEMDDAKILPERLGLVAMLQLLIQRKLEFDRELMSRLLMFVADFDSIDIGRLPIVPVLNAVERLTVIAGVPPEWVTHLRAIQSRLRQADASPKSSGAKLITRIDKLCQSDFLTHLKNDDGWANQMAQEIAALPSPAREHWKTLIQHAASVTPASPGTWDVSFEETGIDEGAPARAIELRLDRTCDPGWDLTAGRLIDSIGIDEFRRRVTGWIERVPDSKPGSLSQFSINREILRGLLWCLRTRALPDTTAAIMAATEFFYKKNSPLAVTGVSILQRIGTTEALMQLTVLEERLKFSSQKDFVRAARRRIAPQRNISFDDLDDLTIPASGFTELGRRVEILAGFRAEIAIAGRTAKLAWFKQTGKPQASIPAAVKREHSSELKGLQQSVKAVETTLSTSIARFEAAPLGQRSWRIAEWKSRYLDHPVVGTIVRRLIWQVTDSGRRHVTGWDNGQFVDVHGNPVSVNDDATIELWHPIHDVLEDILAWRRWLETRQITQPFKQAHRELYLLTDAERNTRVYSNRFASHILKQSQYRVLAKSRGWTSDYLGQWDSGDTGVAKLALPKWDLLAEFWVTGAGTEMAEGAGGYLYVATDQVRLYRIGAVEQPMNLSEVPPLVLSEVLRDVDLFVGVCSVGNDANWQDGGPEGRYRNYWNSYSFGELSETAKTRKAVLETLVPRLRIASQCEFVGHFLIVHGQLRTYKIHLGSANILMEPNDQYLCIVSDQGSQTDKQPMFLPFEGDRTLSLILSKAFLLADDTKISDVTITRQIVPHVA